MFRPFPRLWLFFFFLTEAWLGLEEICNRGQGSVRNHLCSLPKGLQQSPSQVTSPHWLWLSSSLRGLKPASLEKVRSRESARAGRSSPRKKV